jgi:hypothetical protein
MQLSILARLRWQICFPKKGKGGNIKIVAKLILQQFAGKKG